MNSIPRPDLTSLQPYIDVWGLPTAKQRVVKRVSSAMAEIQAFYDAFLPRLQELIEYLDQFPIESIPADDQPLANTLLSLCEVDNAVNKWRAPTLDTGIAIQNMVEKVDLYDRRLT